MTLTVGSNWKVEISSVQQGIQRIHTKYIISARLKNQAGQLKRPQYSSKEKEKMQRLLSLKLASILTKKLSNTTTTSSLFISHAYKPFASFTKPVKTHAHNHHQHHHVLSHKLHGFISNPLVLTKRFFHSSNTFRTLTDSRLGFLRTHFPKRSSELVPGFPSNWHNW